MLIIVVQRGWTFCGVATVLQSYDVFVPDLVSYRVAEADVERSGDILFPQRELIV